MQVLVSIQTLELIIQKTEFAIDFHTDFAAGSEDVRINDLPQAVSGTQALLDELATSLVHLNMFRHYLLSSVFEILSWREHRRTSTCFIKPRED